MTSFINIYFSTLSLIIILCLCVVDFRIIIKVKKIYFLYFHLQCGAGGCLIELAQELLVIMVGKQVINNIQEFVCP